MTKTRQILALGLLVTVAACAGIEVPVSGPSVHETAIGPVLADAGGMTLYTYARDEPGKSACTGLCAVAWPPAKAGPGAVAPAGFSVITGPDGEQQWAQDGAPLYGYYKDRKPGDVTGDGVDGVWSAARP